MDRREEAELAALGHPGLHRHRPAGCEPVPHKRVELLGEQHARRPFLEWLHEIDGDEVEALLALLEIAARVLVPQLGPGVVERALMHLRQVRLAELDDLAVDVHHDGAVDGGIPEDLPQGGALAAADHEGASRRPVGGEQARVDQGLVIDELIALARLDPPVEHQGLAVGRRL